MTSLENSLCLCLVKEHFGELCSRIAAHLVAAKKIGTLQLIAQDLGVERRRVATALSLLIEHGLVEYAVPAPPKLALEYKLTSRRVLGMLTYAMYARQAAELFASECAAAIVRELLTHGQLEASSVLLKCVVRMCGGVTAAARAGQCVEQCRDAFERLVESGYVERLPDVIAAVAAKKETISTADRVPRFAAFDIDDTERFAVPYLRFDG